MTSVIIASVALLVGVAVAPFARRSAGSLAVLDAFTLVMVSGIVAVLLMPEAFEIIGYYSLPFFAVGAVLPLLVGHRVQSAAWVAAVGLAIHAFADGGALAVGQLAEHAGHDHGGGHGHGLESIGLAVLAHRLPVGLVLGGMAKSASAAWGAAALIVAATFAGYWGGSAVIEGIGNTPLAALEALVAGGLTHVVFGHRLKELAPTKASRSWWLLGALLGCGAVAALALSHF